MASNLSLSRRGLLAGVGATTFSIGALGALPALAVTEQQAQSLVSQMVDAIQRTIRSNQSDSAMISDFESLFERYADVPAIARFTLGAGARSASASELQSFTDAFSTYVASKYGRRFREFIGGEVSIRGSRTDSNGNVVVSAVAELRGEEPFDVDFLVSDRSGSPKVVNVIIEGVNMLTTERGEISALLDQANGDISQVIQRMRSS